MKDNEGGSTVKDLAPLPLADRLKKYGDLVDSWYPVAWSADLGDAPIAVELMETPVVLWRSGSEVVAFYDLCIHRGTPLSLGRVSGAGELICAYHGWHYDGTGSCTWIPSRPRDRSIPAKARAVRFHVAEKYAAIWVCLGTGEGPIPEFPPEIDDPAYTQVAHYDDTWNCNAARFVENMMDNSHFAWVHPGTFGTEDKPIVAPVEVEENDHGFNYTCVEPIGNMVEPDTTHIRHYELTTPFMILFRAEQPGRPERDVIWYVCSPVSSKVTRFFFFIYRNYTHPMPVAERMKLTELVQSQDRRMVEAQRPEELPVDLREELHLRGPDDVAMRYRRLLAGLGVDWQ